MKKELNIDGVVFRQEKLAEASDVLEEDYWVAKEARFEAAIYVCSSTIHTHRHILGVRFNGDRVTHRFESQKVQTTDAAVELLQLAESLMSADGITAQDKQLTPRLRVYVASSWRNEEHHQTVVNYLREAGFLVYDFRRQSTAFSWSELDPNWRDWTTEQQFEALTHPKALAAYRSDAFALKYCDACVLVQPCGNSAHLELGATWSLSASKTSIVYTPPGVRVEPELMLAGCNLLTSDLEEVRSSLMAAQEYLGGYS